MSDIDIILRDRLLGSAYKLVSDLGIVEKHEPGKIHAMDAWRYIAKTMREMRMAIAVGDSVDIDKVVSGVPAIGEEFVDGKPNPGHVPKVHGVADHLGISDTAGIAAIKAAFTAERDSFAAHVAEATKKIGQEHAHFHEDHGLLDGRALPKKRSDHTGEELSDPHLPPSTKLNHETFDKVKAGAKVG